MARHGRYPKGCHYHYRIKPLFRSTWFDYALLYFWAHVRADPFLVKTCQDPTSAAWSTQGIESKSHDIMLEEPCRTNAWSIPISSPISKEDTCIRDIKKLLVRLGSPRWAHFMVGSVHHSPWIREVCHFVEVMAPVGLEWFSVGSRRLKNTLVGGFKHFLFSVSYMGQSFPLTNSYFSRWLKPRSSLVLQELVQLWRLGKLRSINNNQKSSCSTHHLDSFTFHLN